MKSIVKIVHLPSVVQSELYEVTRILFVRKENKCIQWGDKLLNKAIICIFFVNGTVTSLLVFIQNILNCVRKMNEAFMCLELHGKWLMKKKIILRWSNPLMLFNTVFHVHVELLCAVSTCKQCVYMAFEKRWVPVFHMAYVRPISIYLSH